MDIAKHAYQIYSDRKQSRFALKVGIHLILTSLQLQYWLHCLSNYCYKMAIHKSFIQPHSVGVIFVNCQFLPNFSSQHEYAHDTKMHIIDVYNNLIYVAMPKFDFGILIKLYGPWGNRLNSVCDLNVNGHSIWFFRGPIEMCWKPHTRPI